MPQVVLVRHGATEWSETGRHTGWTDLPLTLAGERGARALREPLHAGWSFGLVLTSPLQRARHTAALAGYADAEPTDDLREWDYGGYDGLTTAEIRAQRGGSWSLWRDGVVPGLTPGETLTQVAERASRVLDRCAEAMAGGTEVVLFAHGHVLRVLATRWLGVPADAGALLALSAATYSVLGHEHETAVVYRWNVSPTG